MLARPLPHIAWEWPSALAGDAARVYCWSSFAVFCSFVPRLLPAKGTLVYAICAMEPPL